MRCVIALLATIVVGAMGCGGGQSGMDVYPVTGTVTQDGKPVAKAMVGFAPQTSVEGFAGAQVQSDADGQFVVVIAATKGQPEKKGLPAGEYRVTVVKMESPGGAPSLNNPPKNALPSKYATAQSSPLRATVKADGENVVELKL